MERVTVNLTARGSRALEEVTALTEESKTDCINRALAMYAYVQTVLSKGGVVLIQEHRGDEPVRLVIF